MDACCMVHVREQKVENVEEANLFCTLSSTTKTADDIITMLISPYKEEELNWN